MLKHVNDKLTVTLVHSHDGMNFWCAHCRARRMLPFVRRSDLLPLHYCGIATTIGNCGIPPSFLGHTGDVWMAHVIYLGVCGGPCHLRDQLQDPIIEGPY